MSRDPDHERPKSDDAGEADRRDEEDPFETLSEAADERSGNPFDALDGESDRSEGSPDATSGPSTGPAGSPSASDQATAGSTGEPGVSSEEDPPGFGPRSDGPRSGEGDPFAAPNAVFEDVEIGDAADVWSELDKAAARGSVADARERTYAEVSKHAFCKGCEHFSAPPDVGCTHGEAEILEFLDWETVRVVDCPIVEERRRLEEET